MRSLPLMGIGNSWSPTSGGKRSRTSLPLMGIGNNRIGHHPGGQEDSSLPLMGIGNVTWICQGMISSGLITPHGDWKPVCRNDWPAIQKDSLPLMGIGNSRATLYASHRSLSHYPSWGLETPLACREAPTPTQLITPHGDWKRPRPISADRPRRSAHYPSWGLETRGGGRGDRRVLSSLPLMGIGNAIQKEIDENNMISLPLMGIGNCAYPWHRRCP